MYFYFITSLSIIIPFLSNNKILGLKISFFMLFILLGFQYELVQDWEPNIGRWAFVNLGGEGYARELEPLFVFLLKLFKPITFFGWLILTAALFLFLLYKLMRSYVLPKYYWITIFLFMLRTDYGLLFINSNRQCWSLIFTILAVIILLKKTKTVHKARGIKFELLKNSIALVLIYAGSQCHSAAYAAFLIPALYWISKIYKGEKHLLTIIICNLLYLGKDFVNFSQIQSYFSIFTEERGIEQVNHYIEAIGSISNTNSFFEISCYCILITTTCFYYHKMNRIFKFFSIMWYVGLIIYSYFPGNVGRMGEYMYYYLLILLPHIIMYLKAEKKQWIIRIRPICFAYLILYCIWSSWKNMHFYLYERWMDYTSIFEAKEWI